MTGASPDRPQVEEIPRDECVTLLRAMAIGRIAVSVPEDAPLVVPVNYVLDGEVVVFRSDAGIKLARLQGHPASFQVDFIDPFHRAGWSVLVQGVAREVTVTEVEHLSLASWAGAPNHWVRLVPATITGRRIVLPEIEVETRGYR